jgi:branched-chain amino acid transport system ATP-binding protein
VEGILGVLRRIHREGVGVFLVEQNVQASLALADRGYVLENGRISRGGSGRDLLQDPHVRQAYLGPLAMSR